MPPTQSYELLVIMAAVAVMVLSALLATIGKRGPACVEYFLAGRGIGGVVLGLSLSVTTLWILLVGVAGSGVDTGCVVGGAVAITGLLLLGVLSTSLYRSEGAVTFPAFLGARYGRTVALVVATVSIALTLFVYIPVTIFVGTRLLQAALGWELMSSALLMIVLPGLVVVGGGFRGGVALQSTGAVVASLGLVFVSLYGFSTGGGPVPGVIDGSETRWAFALPGMAVLGVWFMCLDQAVFQRVVSARSGSAIRGGLGLAALLIAAVIAPLALGFTAPLAGDPGFQEHHLAMGFVGAAVIAFVVATLSGQFMSVATIFALDIFPGKRKRGSEAAVVLVGRLTNTLVVIVAILSASSVALVDIAAMEWMGRAIVIAVPPVAAVAVVGSTWGRMHGRGALWGISAGWVVGLAQLGALREGLEGALGSAALTFLASALVFVIVSLVSAPGTRFRPLPSELLEEGLEGRKL